MFFFIFYVYETVVKVMEISTMEKKVRAEYQAVFNNYVCMPIDQGCYIGAVYYTNCTSFDAFSRWVNWSRPEGINRSVILWNNTSQSIRQ